MLAAPTPANEAERLESLRRMHLLYSPAEGAFDSLTRTVKAHFGVPVVVISVLDHQRQWFKSCIGLPVRDTAREISFCGHAIMQDEVMVVEDATLDERFADNPLVTASRGIRFYAGRPLKNHEGMAIGTLCIIDFSPRAFSNQARQLLDDYGRWAELALHSRQLGEVHAEFLAKFDDEVRYEMLDSKLNVWKKTPSLEALQREVMRSYHQHSALSVVCIKLLDGEVLERRLGKEGFESLLTEFCQTLSTTIRAYDVIGRLSEHEFLVILPNADETRANEIMTKFRRSLGFLMFEHDGALLDVEVAMGLGWADYTSQTPEAKFLLDMASENLSKFFGASEQHLAKHPR